MRRNGIVLTVVLAVGLVAGASPAAAGPVVPYNAHPRGHPYASWTRMVGQWFLGDASNPLFGALGGDCGEVMNGVFFMAAPIDVGVQLDCDVPTGTPIVLSHAGWFSTEGIDGETDAELEAAAIAGFVTSVNVLTLDGKALPLQPIDTLRRHLGAGELLRHGRWRRHRPDPDGPPGQRRLPPPAHTR